MHKTLIHTYKNRCNNIQINTQTHTRLCLYIYPRWVQKTTRLKLYYSCYFLLAFNGTSFLLVEEPMKLIWYAVKLQRVIFYGLLTLSLNLIFRLRYKKKSHGAVDDYGTCHIYTIMRFVKNCLLKLSTLRTKRYQKLVLIRLLLKYLNTINFLYATQFCTHLRLKF